MGRFEMNSFLGLLSGMLAILTPVAIVFIIFGFRHLRDIQRQKTIRLAIEKGLDLAPFLGRGVALPPDANLADPQRYVLRGLLWGLPGVALGMGVTWAAIQHGARGFTIIGWIPAAIGAAYLIFAKFMSSQPRNIARPAAFQPSDTQSAGTSSAHLSGTETQGSWEKK